MRWGGVHVAEELEGFVEVGDVLAADGLGRRGVDDPDAAAGMLLTMVVLATMMLARRAMGFKRGVVGMSGRGGLG